MTSVRSAMDNPHGACLDCLTPFTWSDVDPENSSKNGRCMVCSWKHEGVLAFRRQTAKERKRLDESVNVFRPGAGDVEAAAHAGVDWLLDDWVPKGNLTILTGPAGIGKSTLTLQLAIAVQSGRLFLGLQPATGSSLLLSAEDHREALLRAGNRLEAGADMPELVFPAGEDFLWTMRDGEGWLTAMGEWLEDRIGDDSLAVVALDSSSTLFGGADTSKSEVLPFVSWLDNLAAERCVAIVLLHHPTKAGAGDSGVYAGSYGWLARARHMLALRQVRAKGEESRFELAVFKSNLGPKPEPLSLSRSDAGWTLSGNRDEEIVAYRLGGATVEDTMARFSVSKSTVMRAKKRYHGG